MENNLTIKILRNLVSIPSFIGPKNRQSEIAMAKFLVEYFKEKFKNFQCTKLNFEGKRYNLLFQNAKKINILFACHMDTVPPSSENALKLKIKNDKAFGLGTKDMKGGIVSVLLALEVVKNKKGVGILFYGDEETTFKGILKVTKEAKKLFVLPPKLIVSPESRFNLGIGARGICVFKLKVYGLRAHSARPNLGVDAVKGFYQLILKTEKLINISKTNLGNTTINIANLHGGLLQPDGTIGIHVGTIPDFVEATISIRNAQPLLDAQKIVGILEKEGRKLKLKIKCEVVEDFPARNVPYFLVKKISRAICNAGFRAEIGDPKTSGFNDMAILGREIKSPVVNFGPYGEGNHTKDEWVSLKSITDTVKVFINLVNEFSKEG